MGKTLQFQQLEDRLLLTVASNPDKPLAVADDPLAIDLMPINADSLTDLASLGSSGELTIAINGGDDRWNDVRTVDLGLGPLNGMRLAPFDADLFTDLVVQGPETINLLSGDLSGGFALTQSIVAGATGTLAPADGGAVQMAAAGLDPNGTTDLVTVAPGTDEVLVLLGSGTGTLSGPVRYASGAHQPIAVVVGDLVGNVFPDIAVGHYDGTVTFLEGVGDGTFVARTELSIGGLGTITGLTASDFDGDGDVDIAVSGTDQVNLLLNDDDALTSSPIVNGDFSLGMTGWRSEIVGHAPGATPGTVSALGNFAQLTEHESFLVSIKQSFVVPPVPETISVDIVSLGLEDAAGGVPDAFEISLLDEQFNALVPVHRPAATSFFNANPGRVLSMATGVTFDGTTVTVDISHIAPGTHATLYFDLIGNTPGTSSLVAVDNVAILPETVFTETFQVVALDGPFGKTAGITSADVDGDGHVEIVVADAAANQLLVYHRDEAGGYLRSEIDTASFGIAPTAVASGRLTSGDAIDDVAVALSASDLVLTPLIGVSDTTPPTVTFVDPAPDVLLTSDISQLFIQFSEDVRDDGPLGDHSVTNPEAYRLFHFGPNGVFEDGAGDDQRISISSVAYDADTFAAVLTIAATALPLVDAQYVLIVAGDDENLAIEDLAGNRLQDGVSASTTFTVNTPPVLAAVADVSDDEGASVNVSVSFSDPGFADPHSASIDWGDGTVTTATVIESGGHGTITGSHVYADDGFYLLRVTVIDSLGQAAFREATATISNVAPTIVSVTNSASLGCTAAGQTVTVAGTFSDPALGAATESFGGQIDWGDGETGMVSIHGGTFTATHAYQAGGVFDVVLTIGDDDGGLAQAVTTAAVSGVRLHNGQLQIVGTPGRDHIVVKLASGGSASGNHRLMYVKATFNQGGNPGGSDGGRGGSQDFFFDPNDVQNLYLLLCEGDDHVNVHQDVFADVTVYGGPGNDHLDGGSGDDLIDGGLGDDDLWGRDGNDVLVGGFGQDALKAGNDRDVLIGGPGDDDLNGDHGDDILIGGIYSLWQQPAALSAIRSEWIRDDLGYDDRVDHLTGGGGLNGTFVLSAGTVFDDFGENDLDGQGNHDLFFANPADDLDDDSQETVVTVGPPAGSTKFFVVDGSNDHTYRYRRDGIQLGRFDTDATQNVRGATSTAAGDRLWVIDKNEQVYVYDTHDETLLGSWNAGGLHQPEGIATDGSDIWIVDAHEDRVSRYTAAASLLSGGQAAAGYFDLDAENSNPTGITTDGTRIWVTDEIDDKVYVYSLTGTLLGSWQLDTANHEPTGIALDLGGDDGLWVLDKKDNAIYFYAAAATVLDGSLAASAILPLASGNSAAEGIADPGGSINIGDVVSDSIGVVGEVDDWTFTAGAGQTIFIDWQLLSGGATWLQLFSPGGSIVLSDISGIAAGLDNGPITLASAGTYTLRVFADGNTTPTYQFQIWNVPPPDVTTINLGDVANGAIETPGASDQWNFLAAAGQSVFVDWQSLSGGFINIRLEAPDGSTILTDGSPVAVQLDNGPIDLPLAGIYKLVVYGSGDVTPTYQFKLWDVPPPDVTTINIGDVANGAIETPGATDQWHFSAAAGQTVFIDWQSLSGGFIDIRLEAPDGSTILTDGSPVAHQLDNGPIDLPLAGTYKLVVDGSGDVTPTYQFHLWDVPPPDETTIDLDDLASGTIETPGASDAWHFPAIAGQTIFVDFHSIQNGAVTLRLLAPDGSILLTDAGSPPDQLDNGPLTLTQDGLYTLVVGGNGSDTPAYQLTVWNIEADVPTQISLDNPVSDLRAPSESMTFTFEAELGEELAFDVTANANNANAFTLVAPSGATLFTAATGDQVFDPLVEGGTYRLHVSTANPSDVDLSGAFTFELIRLVAPQTGSPDNRGTEFWLTFPRALRAGSTIELTLSFTAAVDTRAIITVPGTDYVQPVDVVADDFVTVLLPTTLQLGSGRDIVEDKGIRVTAADEVVVYGFNFEPDSSDAYLGLPRDVLGTDYIVLGYENSGNIDDTQFALVAAEDDTTVTIIPAVTTGTRVAGVPYDLQLNRGQTYQLSNNTLLADLSGTIISSDKPISVFGGHRCTDVPAGAHFCDHLVEHLPPLETWGRQFLTMPLASRIGGDTFRMLAQQDGTAVTVNGVVVATLDRGQFHEQLIDGPAEITSNLPILVAQYSNGGQFDGVLADPFMMLVPPFEQFDHHYVLSAFDNPNFDRQFLNVVTPTTAVGSVEIDGVPIPPGDFVAIGSSGFSGAQLAVDAGTYRLTSSSPFASYVYGFGQHDAYGFAGGGLFAPVAQASQILLQPETASLLVGSPHTLTATVTDQAAQPLPGIRVDFAMTGAHAVGGFAVTDALGQAAFTFQGEQPGTDSIVAFVGSLFDTATVDWTAATPDLTITSPADGSQFPAGSVQLVTGQALPGDPLAPIVSVTVNGEPVDALDNAGNFFALVTVDPGSNFFTFTATDSQGSTASRSLTLDGTPPDTAPFDVDNLADVTNFGQFTYRRTTFNRQTQVLHADVHLTNVGPDTLANPALAVFAPIRPPSISLVGQVAHLPSPDDRPFLSFAAVVPPTGLAPGSTSGGLALEFSNPPADRFDFDVTLLVPANLPPSFTTAPVLLGVADLPYAYNAAAADPNGDALSFALDVAPDGMFVDSQTGEIDWLPTSADLGLHDVVLAVSDGHGGRATQRFVVHVVQPPPSNRDPIIVSSPVTIVNLAGAANGDYAYDALAVDPDPGPLTYSLTTAPAGMVIDPLSGAIDWPVTASDLGPHTVELRVDDDQGGFDTQTFVVQVVDLQPATIAGTAFADQDADGVRDGNEPGLGGWVVYTDDNQNGRRDAGEPFAVTAVDGSYWLAGLLPGTYVVALQPQTGWTQTAPTAGAHVVTAGEGQVVAGIDFGNFDTGETGNHDPEFTTVPVTTAQVNHLYRYDATATDADGDSLTFSLLSAPAGMVVDPVAGAIVWTPSADQQATQSVLLQVSDGQGGVGLQAFHLFVLPEFQSPTITSVPPRIGSVDQPYQYQVTAFDPDGDPVAFALLAGPVGMAIDGPSGQLTWYPAAADLGVHRVTVRATDATGQHADQSYDLDIRGLNTPPQFTSQPLVDSAAGGVYRYDADAVDTEDGITFHLLAGPAGMSTNAQTGLVTWNPTLADIGTHHVTIRATDDRGATADQSFSLNIEPDSEPPQVSLLLSSILLDPGESVVIQVLANDNVGVAAVALEVDGVPLTLDANNTATFTPSGPGLWSIVGLATDASGHVGTATRSLRVFDPNDTQPPFVEITSPSFGDVVTYLTDIVGTVTDPNLEFYRLEYALAGTDEFATFFESSSEVVDGVLGVFDPTLLPNDPYEVRVFAQDINGQIYIQPIELNVEGQAKLGNFRLEFTDLEIPLAGIPIQINRIYDTLEADYSGDFGFGWQLGFKTARIRETVRVSAAEQAGAPSLFGAYPFRVGTRVYLNNPDGRRVGFTFDPVPEPSFLGTVWRPRFVADPGVYDRLEVEDLPLAQKPDGTFTLFLFSFPYNPSEYTIVTKDQLRYRYDQFNDLQDITDRNDVKLTFTADGIFSSVGQSIEWLRDDQGRITEIIDPAGNAILYAYDEAGNLTSVTDQVGNVARMTYFAEPAHYLDEVTENSVCGCGGGKLVSKVIYDEAGRVAAIFDALGHPVTQTYDLANNTEAIADRLGNETTLVFDDRGNITQEIDPLGNSIIRSYDSNDNEVAVTNKRNFTTLFGYDDRGNVTSITDALSGVYTITYDDFSNVIGTVDELGRTTTRIYDPSGNLIESIDEANGSVLQSFDSMGRITSRTDANSNTFTFVYTGNQSRPTEVINPDGVTRRAFSYDIYGQVTAETDELGRTTTYQYDNSGRLVSSIHPDGQTLTNTYELGAFVATTILINGTESRTTHLAYDELSRISATTDENGGVTSFTYDAAGNLLSFTDPELNTTSYEYDKLNRISKIIDPLSNESTYTYDEEGNLSEAVDRNGRRQTFEYDELNRLTAEYWWDQGSIIRTTTTTYDAVGNILTQSDPDSSLTFTYDVLNRLTSADNAGTPNAPHVVLTYAYDSENNLLSVTDNYGVTVSSVYDTLSQLTSRTWHGGGIDPARIDFAYNDRGDQIHLDRYSDLAATRRIGSSDFGYDDSRRLANIRHLDAFDVAIATYDYIYDLADQVIQESHHGETIDYTYDLLGQLLAADRTVFPDEFYAYDANGNRTSSYLHGSNYVIDADNRLRSDGEFHYVYDPEGNLILRTELNTGNETEYEYDHRNRLIRVTKRDADGIVSSVSEYVYDAQDRRIEEKVDGETTHFAYDGYSTWADFDSSGQVIARYLYGAGIDEILARWRPGEGTAWHLADRLGTVRDVVDVAGVVVIHNDYDSYGMVLVQTNVSAGDRFLFTGREFDAATDQYYYRARYYNAVTGRFGQQDALRFAAGDANLYRYVGNAVTNATDPTGLVAVNERASIESKKPTLLCRIKKLAQSPLIEIFLRAVQLLGEGNLRGAKPVPPTPTPISRPQPPGSPPPNPPSPKPSNPGGKRSRGRRPPPGNTSRYGPC